MKNMIYLLFLALMLINSFAFAETHGHGDEDGGEEEVARMN